MEFQRSGMEVVLSMGKLNITENIFERPSLYDWRSASVSFGKPKTPEWKLGEPLLSRALFHEGESPSANALEI